MATNVSVVLQMSDGSVSYLRNDVTLDTLTEVKTDNSGILNIAGDLSAGQALQGKTVVAAMARVQTDDATSGAFGHCAFYSPQGNIMCLIQGGGCNNTGLQPLKKPVRLTTGVTVKVLAQASAAGMQIGSVAVYCASGKSDIFTGTAVDATSVSMTNKDGNTIGEALSGERAVAIYSSYPGTNGLAEIGVADGINAFFVEDSSGQLKHMAFPGKGAGDEQFIPFVPVSFSINQNDTLTIRANT